MDCEVYRKIKSNIKLLSNFPHYPQIDLWKKKKAKKIEGEMAGFGSWENNTDPPLCANNCGFYGTAENGNLCSVCYNDFLQENPSLISNSSITGEDFREQESADDDVGSKNLFSEFIRIYDQEPNLETKRSSPSASNSSVSKPRCMICKKKVGLLGFNCRCGGLFCGKHRHPEGHSCNVDHKAIGKEILAKQIVECKADKLEFRV